MKSLAEILGNLDFVLAGFIAGVLFLFANHLGWLPQPLSWANPLPWVALAILFLGSLIAVKAAAGIILLLVHR